MHNSVVCLHCDLIAQGISLNPGEKACCPRCKQTLYHTSTPLNKSIALLIAAIVLFFPAITLPFLSLTLSGQQQQISLLGSTLAMLNSQNIALALTVGLLIVGLPLLRFVGLLFTILPLAYHRPPYFSVGLIRWIIRLSALGMIEVYLVATLVTLVKLATFANIQLAEGFYLFSVLVVINALISLALPEKRIWQHIRLQQRAAKNTQYTKNNAQNQPRHAPN
ncbi:paraquat-inducible protein A [Ostreibacterium oceani]|uniref:Paraquat-inducible protein A n=1 Tax=Ostreibacterium oceani TaxID=2654998 RepID=A0A6N7ETG2_9GAMM|nr:paraquat-inducible protein A [Ostreibacterium oceani]MPV85223.1 hypothetical protein [Ostreibacterium oceani]